MGQGLFFCWACLPLFVNISISFYYSLVQTNDSTLGLILPLRKYLAMSVRTWGGSATGTWWVVASGATKHLSCIRTAPPAELGAL